MIVSKLFPLAPFATLRLAGANAREKSGVARAATVTVRASVAERLPDVPFTVNVVALSTALLAAESVSVLVPLWLSALNDAVTPAGKPVAVSATAPLKPPCGETLMAAVPLAPGATFTLDTVLEILNPGAALTVTTMFELAVTVPDVPVTVAVV